MLGLAPNPYLRANMARSICVALLLVFITSTLLFLLSARLGVAQQSINICLDGDDLLHIPAGFLILSIKALFLCRELTAFLLQRIHFRELRPAQQTAHFRLCRPVQFNIGLMLRKEFPAVLGSLVLLKDRACFGIRFLTETESERLMGLPEGWTKYGADGEEIRPLQRYKALGNAIALPCADYIMAGIYEVLADRAGKED